jgi:hypothetical protein
MPFPVLDDAFFSLLTQPDHSKFDTIRWSYETKSKASYPFQAPAWRRKHAEVRRGPDASQLLQHDDEAFEPRLVAHQGMGWRGQETACTHPKKAICRWGVQEPWSRTRNSVH